MALEKVEVKQSAVFAEGVMRPGSGPFPAAYRRRGVEMKCK